MPRVGFNVPPVEPSNQRKRHDVWASLKLVQRFVTPFGLLDATGEDRPIFFRVQPLWEELSYTAGTMANFTCPPSLDIPNFPDLPPGVLRALYKPLFEKLS